MPDLYELLGVPRTAGQAQIKAAYRRLAEDLHPDKAPAEQRAEAEARFKAITAAYNVLKDPRRRAKYDAGGGWALPNAEELAQVLRRFEAKVDEGMHLVAEFAQLAAQARKVLQLARALLQW